MNDVTQAGASAKPKPISRKVREAIASMVAGDTKTVTAATAMVGLSREHLSRELSKPHITEFMKQKVMRSLALASARAPAPPKSNCSTAKTQWSAIGASSFVLGPAGITPEAAPSANINLEIRAGYVIDLSDDPREAKVIPHV